MGAIVVFALGAFFCLWHRTNMLMVILGFLLIIVTVRAVDRAIHTKYVLTNDGVLKVKIGRIGKTTHIPLTDVKTIEKRPFAFRLGYYALIELMNGSVVSVQPDNVDSFMSALQKRIEKKDNEE
ncbi:PH domain-containing protein [Prevotella scopos JCM 17725]|uniref:PH domain-containing protein n=2 Tax=Prevotella TaxID=838 RepID=A0AAX2F4P9_9BACT|nr:PH domain-containing protein [Prevotella scopos JCM 17725]